MTLACSVLNSHHVGVWLQIGSIRDSGLYMPVDETTQLSKGFAFIEFMNPKVPHLPPAILNAFHTGNESISHKCLQHDCDTFVNSRMGGGGWMVTNFGFIC